MADHRHFCIQSDPLLPHQISGPAGPISDGGLRFGGGRWAHTTILSDRIGRRLGESAVLALSATVTHGSTAFSCSYKRAAGRGPHHHGLDLQHRISVAAWAPMKTTSFCSAPMSPRGASILCYNSTACIDTTSLGVRKLVSDVLQAGLPGQALARCPFRAAAK